MEERYLAHQFSQVLLKGASLSSVLCFLHHISVYIFVKTFSKFHFETYYWVSISSIQIISIYCWSFFNLVPHLLLMLIYLHLLILFIDLLANKHLSFIYSNLVIWVHPFNWNPSCLALTWPISSLQSPNYFKVWCTYSNTTRDEQLFGADFKLYFRCSHFRCRCSCISFNFTSHVNSVQTNKCGNVVLAPK